MYRLQVFDDAEQERRWRDVDVILEDECGWCYAFVTLSKPMELRTVNEARSVAVKLAENAQVRVRVLDLEADEVVFDSGTRN